jgi:cytoskeletal protein CcmA (bactofilin family)
MPEAQSIFPERRTVAWIGKAVRVEGKIVSNEDLTIDGEVVGSVELDGQRLVVGQGASIKADVNAKVVTISGTITGNVSATEKIDLQATGTVDGDLKAPRFAMAEGATVKGRVHAG